MMLRGAQGGGGGGGRCLFTASQWRELEQQALIYKYMAAGSQVPHELLLPFRHAAAVDTAPSLACFPPPSHPSLGWGCYGPAAMQYGRRAEDPEPGRCRRTDGKKWRCSREAFGESKYCDRHMHRGKNRSRKPVEPPTPPSSSSSSSYRPSALSISPPTPADAAPNSNSSYGHQFLRPGPSSVSPLQLHLDAPSPPPSYHRYAQPQPPQYSTSSFFPAGHGYGCEFKPAAMLEQHEEALLARRRLGADLSLDKPDAATSEGENKTKSLRRFLDEWPRGDNNGDGRSWMDETTQLSMSIPAASSPAADLAIAASRYHHHNGNE
ncbi:growth-regulating factor 2 [Brachypodium distachyon]|uniref:Growth-regulating factor n=2 Tax=Brachypodium distachyon TaxID=15368 RepID=I1H003_BRADI|nr:growth-regulating factor 2 [Brachypodium distachyon]PNT76253.1 hypothetical protein BRADI_1g46427v3 [Brachypodium distachyon]|eukprot:XP_003560956.1 growth-regulating factor 2 [Brachypodium distachyon]